MVGLLELRNYYLTIKVSIAQAKAQIPRTGAQVC